MHAIKESDTAVGPMTQLNGVNGVNGMNGKLEAPPTPLPRTKGYTTWADRMPKEVPTKPSTRTLISERSIDEARPLKLIYIGAGVSGITGAIEFKKRLPSLDLVIYEKNPEVGGTWFENRYPGCACGETRPLGSTSLIWFRH